MMVNGTPQKMKMKSPAASKWFWRNPSFEYNEFLMMYSLMRPVKPRAIAIGRKMSAAYFGRRWKWRRSRNRAMRRINQITIGNSNSIVRSILETKTRNVGSDPVS